MLLRCSFKDILYIDFNLHRELNICFFKELECAKGYWNIFGNHAVRNVLKIIAHVTVFLV